MERFIDHFPSVTREQAVAALEISKDLLADLAAYDAALQSSTQQIENSFGVVVADEQAEQK